ncbi:hypothetical protein FOZ63_013372 [Perkinsus olseni]|uniref:Uncharacterized protein n=1 Tax=Perkinsus olseni TaxID=32597 RepID=A0A7J6QHM7_PEROL|nr:hypothetical protein FOZ62_014450 [Perkinsus olseni]KAF4714221.1 hypothetical protein FOZ63_013372 [Perkinsus olseni]
MTMRFPIGGIAILLAVRNGSHAESLRDKFEDFKMRYSVNFPSQEEDDYRFEVFRKNLEFIEETNRRNLSYSLGVNAYAALTRDEVGDLHSCSDMAEGDHFLGVLATPPESFGDWPSELNWVARGAVNTPRDQKKCGSCYAIASLGALEGALQIRTGKLQKLSVQQVVDCSSTRPWGNFGCLGGRRLPTFKYVADEGIVSDKDYPYKAKQGSCNPVTQDVKKQILHKGDVAYDSTVRTRPLHPEEVMNELQHGPVAVGIFTNTPEWAHYKSGILDSFTCRGDPGHVMLLVGYGVDRGKSYWLLQDTEGPKRGEHGYVRVVRDPENKPGPGFCNMFESGAFRPVLAHRI